MGTQRKVFLSFGVLGVLIALAKPSLIANLIFAPSGVDLMLGLGILLITAVWWWALFTLPKESDLMALCLLPGLLLASMCSLIWLLYIISHQHLYETGYMFWPLIISSGLLVIGSFFLYSLPLQNHHPNNLPGITPIASFKH